MTADVYDFVAGLEGFSPKAYWDHKQWSIGYGTRANGPGETIDQNAARQRLRDEVDKAQSHVDKAFPNLAPNQRSALASFTYNLGPGWITGPTRMGDAVRSGKWEDASRIMQEYNKASGQFSPGLANRRAKEAALFSGGDVPFPQSSPAAPASSAGPRPMATGFYEGDSPEDVERKRKIASALMSQGTSAAPVGHWTQALARVMQGGMGGFYDQQATAGEKAGRASVTQALMSGTPQEKMAALSRTPWGHGAAMDLAQRQLQGELASETPSAQLERQIKQAQLAQLKRKDAPTFGKIGPDQFGQDQYGWIDPTNQTVTPAAPQGSGQPGLPSGSPLPMPSGEEFLKTLPPAVAEQVKGISEGRIAFPGGFALKQPYWQRMVQLVSQYDPGFDAVNYNARNKTRADFTAGKSAQNITAFNTAIQHLDTLEKSIAGLENSGYRFWNKIANPIRENTDPKYAAAVTNFNTARTAVADELTRAFRGSGGNVHDIIQWEKNINTADSPEALRAAVKQAIHLLDGRIFALADQYNRGMGTTKDRLELLSPKAQDAVKRMLGEDGKPAKEGAAGAATPQGAPPPGQYAWNPQTGKIEPVGGAPQQPAQPAPAPQAAPAAPAELGSRENPIPNYREAQPGKFFMHQGNLLFLDPKLGPVRAP